MNPFRLEVQLETAVWGSRNSTLKKSQCYLTSDTVDILMWVLGVWMAILMPAWQALTTQPSPCLCYSHTVTRYARLCFISSGPHSCTLTGQSSLQLCLPACLPAYLPHKCCFSSSFMPGRHVKAWYQHGKHIWQSEEGMCEGKPQDQTLEEYQDPHNLGSLSHVKNYG